MSQSRVYRVPEDLHENVEAAYMDFVTKNPVLAMGADERRRRLNRAGNDPKIRAALQRCTKPVPEYAKELGFDPDDDGVLSALGAYPPAREFLKLVRGWPRSMAERAAFARRAMYSTFVTQFIEQGIGKTGTHHADFDEGTHGWEPSLARTIKREAFL